MAHRKLRLVERIGTRQAIKRATLALAFVGVSVQAQQVTAPRVIYDERAGYNLAFVDADVRRVVDAILGSMLEVRYSVDPAVTGNVTIRTAKPVAEESLIPLLEEALTSIDAVIVKRPDGYQVVPRSVARGLSPLPPPQMAQASGETRNFPPSEPGYASEEIALNFANAANLVEVMKDFLGDGIAETARNGTNAIVISGSGSERDAAKALIARFDVDTLANMSYEIWRLDNVDAATLVRELQQIFKPPYDILGSRIRLVPLPRLRSVMGIAGNRADLALIEPWITRLDNGGSGKRRLYSYSVQNGRARDLAVSLQQVLGNVGATSSFEESSIEAPVDVREGTGEAQSSGSTAFPSYSDTGSQALRIVPNGQNNSLLIYADGEEYDFIREALDKLDQPVAQVLIEAILAEVTLNDDLQYGVNFTGIQGSSPVVTATQSNSGSAVPASVFPGFSVSVIGNSASAVLNTLQSKTDVRVVSAPKLVTLNNEAATLQVGDQVPIVTQQAQSVVTPGAPIVNNIELRDTGVILQVTPRVNDSGTIILDISQEVSDVAETTSSGINSPTIRQRKLTSTVATRSGQMVALGGLIRNQTVKTKSGIPLLSTIPIVGGLFGQQKTTGARTELIVLLTPTVIRSEEETRNVVNSLIDGLDLARPLVDGALKDQANSTPSLQVPDTP